MMNFTIPLHGLIGNGTHEADHNRLYYFTFEIMNEAHLITIDKVRYHYHKQQIFFILGGSESIHHGQCHHLTAMSYSL